MTEHRDMPRSEEPSKPRRGRPLGCESILPEDRRMLIATIEAGTAPHVAFAMIGVRARTYRDYRARYMRRHPTRRSTSEIDELFRDVDQAHARARAAREIAVAKQDPKLWLRYLARSEPGLIGWSDPVPEDEAEQPRASAYQPTPEEFEDTLRVLVEATGIGGEQAGEPEESEESGGESQPIP